MIDRAPSNSAATMARETTSKAVDGGSPFHQSVRLMAQGVSIAV
jgi:hypothetical protein